jgi:hypothetical protein
VLITTLLILHGVAAVILIGAITHQAIGVWKTKPAPSGTFFQSLVNVRGTTYTNAIVLLYVITAILGGIVYPVYVLDVKGTLTDAQMLKAIGAFELKEHYAIIGLAMLPTYWYLWKKVPLAEQRLTRQLNTTVIAVMVWVSFFVGHILNNIKGLI